MERISVLCVHTLQIRTTAVYLKITLAKVKLSEAIFSRESLLFLAVLRLTESEGIEGWSLSRP